MSESLLLKSFDLLATAQGGVGRLKVLILSLAVQGKLVPQDAGEEPMRLALERLKMDRDNSYAKGRSSQIVTEIENENEDPTSHLPTSWETVRLGDVVEVLDSLRRPVTKEDRKPGPFPYYGASGIVDYVSSFIFDEPLVLVGEDGAKWQSGDSTAFKIAGKTWVNNHAHVLRPYRSVLVDEFLVFSLVAMDLSPFITGMTVPKLNQNRLQSIPLALPPLTEQFRIVTRIEELMTLCDALENGGRLADEHHARLTSTLFDALAASESAPALAENWERVAENFDLLLDRPEAIAVLERTTLQLAVRGLLVHQDSTEEPSSALLHRIQSARHDMAANGTMPKVKPTTPISDAEYSYSVPKGWTLVRMQEAFDVRDGTHDTPKYVESDGIPLITSRNFVNGDISFSDAKLISRADHADIKKRSGVARNDILYSMIGGNIGNQVLVTTDVEFSIKNVALFKHYVPDESMPQFLNLFLKTVTFNIQTNASGGAQPFVSLGLLRNIPIPIPPAAEQRRIVNRTEELTRMFADLRASMTLSQEAQVHLSVSMIDAESSARVQP